MERSSVDDVVLVGGSTRIPKVQQLLRDMFDGKELCKGINPDEAVAYGAAVQATILGINCSEQEVLKQIVLSDVTPLSLGFGFGHSSGLVMGTLIPRNTAIPCRKSRRISTLSDNQTAIQVLIYEGERAMAKDNNLLGNLKLSGIPPAPRRVPNLECCFEIDANGILNVTAEDKSTGKKQHITISREKGLLGDEEIKKMVDEAAKYRAQDREIRERRDARVAFESFVCSIRHDINCEDTTASFAATDKKKAQEAVEESLLWIDDNPLPTSARSRNRGSSCRGSGTPLLVEREATTLYKIEENPNA